jgi:hypothetical protein
MLTADEQSQLRQIATELRGSDPWLARCLEEHRLPRRLLRHRLADVLQQMLSAWMDAAGQLSYPWPGHRGY